MISESPPLLRTLSRLRGAFWRRRFARGLVRSLWLALLAPVAVMAGYLWLGWQVPWVSWVTAGAIVGGLSLLWSLRPIRLKSMTHRLDDLLGAHAGLITAFEVSQVASTAPNPVADQLVRDAVNLSVDARRKVATLNRGFWLELQALVAVAAILGALLVIDALSANLPQATPVELPAALAEPHADEVIPPDAQLMPPPFQPPAMSPAQTQAALEALAEALRDQAVSRAVAEAIDQGDMAGAAEALRRLADQLEGLSEEARQELGQALQQAREAIGGDAPGFSEPLQQGSQALQQGDVPAGGRALDELAETIEGISTQPQPGTEDQSQPGDSAQAQGEGDQPAGGEQAGAGDGAGAGEEGQGDQGLSQEAERLPIDGAPLELEAGPDLGEHVLQPAELDAASGEGRTSDSPFARQPLNAAGDDLGADPLTYPWEQRDVIKRYFTPQN